MCTLNTGNQRTLVLRLSSMFLGWPCIIQNSIKTFKFYGSGSNSSKSVSLVLQPASESRREKIQSQDRIHQKVVCNHIPNCSSKLQFGLNTKSLKKKSILFRDFSFENEPLRFVYVL